MQKHAGDRPSDLPRWLQIGLGVMIAVLAGLCAFASLSLFFAPAARNRMQSIIVGAVFVVGGIWVFSKAIRLILGRPLKGGLLSPWALRIASMVTLGLPVCGLFTGYFGEHPIIAPIQTMVYVGLSFYLWRLARARAEQAAKKDI